MSANSESVYSNDDVDAGEIAQQRAIQLQKSRDGRVEEVFATADRAMKDLRSRVMAFQKERSEKRRKEHAAMVLKLIESATKKADIEAQMQQEIAKLHKELKDVEAMMAAGYEGRERDLKEAEEGKV